MMVHFIDRAAKEVIACLKADGFYKQKGNTRMFVGPTGERLTVYSPTPIRSLRPGSLWGTAINGRYASVVITNTLDIDMVEQDVKLLVNGGTA